MKTVRVVRPEGPRHGIVIDDVVHLARAPLPTIEELTGETVALAEARLLTPVQPSKIFAVGRNYVEHLEEMGYTRPTQPSIFMKPPTTLLADGGSVVLPTQSDHVEHEAELAVVIGRRARDTAPREALDHVFGFTCSNDVSARDVQRRDGRPMRGKGFDTFCPLGPWIETELDVQAGVHIRCRVNGETRQDGHTSSMLFDVPFVLSYLSQFATLLPGDVVLTGSPGGTERLEPGDVVEVEVEGVGTLRNDVVAAALAPAQDGWA